MPAPAMVTPDEVAAAAAQLAGAGQAIGGWSLRRVLGRGRPDRLAAIYAEQQAGQAGAVPESDQAPALPPGIMDFLAAATERQTSELAGIVAQAWGAAHNLAQRRMADEVEGARARVAVLEGEQAEALAMLEAADERAGGLSAELDAARAELARMQDKDEAVVATLAAATARADAAEREVERWRTMLGDALARLPMPAQGGLSAT